MPDPTEQHLHHLFATLNSLARSYQNNGADEASLLSLAKKIQADPVALEGPDDSPDKDRLCA